MLSVGRSGVGGGGTCAKGMRGQIKSFKVCMHKDPGLGCVGTRERTLLRFDINVRKRPRPNELQLRREGRCSVLPSLEVLLKAQTSFSSPSSLGRPFTSLACTGSNSNAAVRTIRIPACMSETP